MVRLGSRQRCGLPGGSDGTDGAEEGAEHVAEGPRMNKEPEFLAAKLRCVHDPHVRPPGSRNLAARHISRL